MALHGINELAAVLDRIFDKDTEKVVEIRNEDHFAVQLIKSIFESNEVTADVVNYLRSSKIVDENRICLNNSLPEEFEKEDNYKEKALQ